jgi:hypothetical protein
LTRNIELIASYWTIAGDVYPLGPNEISPFPFEKLPRRVIAAWVCFMPTSWRFRTALA